MIRCLGGFLQTGAFAGEYGAFSARGMRLVESPRREAYATVAVFGVHRGAIGDLIQPTGAAVALA